ncbi:MAG: aminodeoxychorismate synthase component I [Lentisphaerae bacterium]|nr:aminodeoxychorismate synthase component I [Lentisphaerota bacterium]MCP4103554.1 aminodeoxychorismate synthase component I [Lentisphaerota bacterium]
MKPLSNKHIAELMKAPGCVICRLPDEGAGWGVFSYPERVLCAYKHSDVMPVVDAVDAALAQGKHVAGFLAYEAGAAFDKAFPARDTDGFPLAWFGVYATPPAEFVIDNNEPAFAHGCDLQPEVSVEEYNTAIRDVLDNICAGNIYQTNYTFRMRGGVVADPARLFRVLFRKHPVPYAAFVNTEEFQLVSVSPEIFLERRGNKIHSSPMKGTMKRDPDLEIDRRNAEFLKHDEKNLAENMMIVDMVRNDLGRIAEPDSVHVNPLFHVDTYGTVHQMISTVHAELSCNKTFSDIMRETFPAASITGAPKVSAMNHIHRLEGSPRKVYTGSIGCAFPDGDMCFNVSIRTLICKEDSTELGIGGGIVYDSGEASEWDEALLKGKFIRAAEPDFEILETMLWQKGKRIADLDEHLKRMKKSADFFGFSWNRKAVMDVISSMGLEYEPLDNARLRLLLLPDGSSKLQVFPLADSGWGKDVLKVCISHEKIDSSNIFFRNKTTNRELYNREFKRVIQDGFDEVLFVNEREELTEGAISNVFIRLTDKWYTPPVECGLLPGIWRQRMLKELSASERIIKLSDLQSAEEILIGNSVRNGALAVLA